MDKATLVTLIATWGPWALSAVIALLWWLAPKGEDLAIAAMRKAAKALTPEQQIIVEKAILWVDEHADRFLDGDEKLMAAVEWAANHGVPVNRSVVQWVYNLLKATGRKGWP